MAPFTYIKVVRIMVTERGRPGIQTLPITIVISLTVGQTCSCGIHDDLITIKGWLRQALLTPYRPCTVAAYSACAYGSYCYI